MLERQNAKLVFDIHLRWRVCLYQATEIWKEKEQKQKQIDVEVQMSQRGPIRPLSYELSQSIIQ